MGWNKDGSTIRAQYLNEYDITGVVTDSRVKYGGKGQYTVQLDKTLYIKTGRNTDVVLIDEDQVTFDFGVLPDDQKIVRNLMTGEPVVIDKDTPWCCNPASETFWSM